MPISPIKRGLATSIATAMIAAPAAWADTAPKSATTADAKFMQTAEAAGLGEIAMGKLALAQSGNDQVKALAQKLIDDHTKADQQLETLAASKQVTLPTQPGDDAQKAMKTLHAKHKDAFDEAWLKEAVKDHKAAVKDFTTESKKGKDADVRQFAQNTLPTLKDHLAAASKLAGMYDARDHSMDAMSKAMSQGMDSNTMPSPVVTPSAAPTSASSGKGDKG